MDNSDSEESMQLDESDFSSDESDYCNQASFSGNPVQPLGETKEKKKQNWTTLMHNVPLFYPSYKRLPSNIRFFYDSKEMRLSEKAEEVARFYAELLDKEWITEEKFQNNFFEEWRKDYMTEEERSRITELSKCDFKDMQEYSKEETKKIKEQLKAQVQDCFCIIDGHKQAITNCKVESPGLFRGAQRNSNNGRIKKRVQPEDVTINCSEDAKPVPPPGHNWKEVVCEKNLAWLAKWTETISNKQKEIRLPGNDEGKFQLARRLHEKINEIRKSYKEDWESNEIKIQQRGVALYFIDKLAIRAGHEKEKGTVGCCALRAHHVKELHEENGKFFIHLNFNGKGNVLYDKKMETEELPYNNLQLFITKKAPEDNLFDQLTAKQLNDHLDEFIKGLTSKVYRTYHASLMFEKKLNEIKATATCKEKVVAFKEAVSDVSKLLNHENTKNTKKTKNTKLYYLDPQITVAWCLKNNILIDEVYTKTQQTRFQWAIDNNDEGYCYEKPKPVNSEDVIISGIKSASLEDS